MEGCSILGWFLLVAALFSTTNGLQADSQSQRKRDITVEQTINVYATAEQKLQWNYPELSSMDCYTTDPSVLANAVEYVLHDILQESLSIDVFLKIDCTFAAQFIAGLKYLLVDDAFPEIHEKLISLLDLSVAKSASIEGQEIRINILRHNNISHFIDILYMPGLGLIDEFAHLLDQTSTALDLFKIIEDMIYFTYIKHLTAHQFVIEVVVVLYDWIENIKPVSQNHSYVTCQDIVTKLDDKLQSRIAEIQLNLNEDQLKLNIEASFGQSFIAQEEIFSNFVNLTLMNIKTFEVPIHLFKEIHAGMETNPEVPVGNIRLGNGKALAIILGKHFEATKTEYYLEKTLFKVKAMSPIPFSTPVLEVKLLDLEILVAELHKYFLNLKPTCEDIKLVGILPGIVEVHSFDFSLRNVHMKHIVEVVKDMIHHSNPSLSKDQRGSIFMKTGDFLTEFYLSKMKLFISKIEDLLKGTVPTETILTDTLFKLWDSKPGTLEQLLLQSGRIVYHSFAEEVVCQNTLQDVALHAKGTMLIQEFLKSLEITKDDIPEEFYSSIFCDNATKPLVEDFLVKDSQLEIAHLIEDIHLLMVDLKNCTSIECYRNGYRKFFSEKLALMIYKHLQLSNDHMPPPVYTAEDHPTPEIDHNLMAVFMWQHNVIQNFTVEYMKEFEKFTSEMYMNMCENDPEFCKLAIEEPLK